MSELLSSITGGGGGFVTKFASPTIIVSSGATGTIATITPPAGQKVRLTALSGQTLQTNLTTVTSGGVDVISLVLLESRTNVPDGANELVIGYSDPNHQFITFETGDIVEIKTNLATSSNTLYAYEFGE